MIDIAAYAPDWPAEVYVSLYLAIGLAIGIYAIKDGDSESPVGSLMFLTFAGPLFAAVAAVVVMAIAPFWLIVELFGFEEAGSDTRGV